LSRRPAGPGPCRPGRRGAVALRLAGAARPGSGAADPAPPPPPRGPRPPPPPRAPPPPRPPPLPAPPPPPAPPRPPPPRAHPRPPARLARVPAPAPPPAGARVPPPTPAAPISSYQSGLVPPAAPACAAPGENLWRPLAPEIMKGGHGSPEIQLSCDYPDCWK